MINLPDRIPVYSSRTYWIVAIFFFGIGDIATTTIGLKHPQIVESHPLAAALIDEAGLSAMVAMKLSAFAFFGGVWSMLPDPPAIGIPIGLSIIGVVVTGWNIHVILLLI